ncbi:MAG: methyl-accepting chemotaxis protein [Alphaproteobacteria bacterium]|nr:methyl-accepting chemotaxis protein [Alphaproteobacteria bacterium]MBU0803961.1 methyl-accepting chemotaxis protein [Alphaproteobacteria bacterium]MBU0872742.1 methyl-accepting chemotaxis protein [Alphaproteobacteria bacterium]MBU1402888.1 methyl-accepting chemotaxis protein [Alphaproteobacteria bacterium]MBU1593530.1 methyl-accepting chemotaxis protein [Alphaproteobacteria bacterium]
MTETSSIGGAQSVLRASLGRSGKWAAGLGAVGGFIADILQPLAPFAAYIALVAAIAAMVVAVAIVLRLVLATKALPALVFATTTAAIAGGVFALQQADDAEDGVLASLVPAIAGLQQSMGIVSARVEAIQETVTETQKTVEEVQQTTEEVQQTTQQVQQTTEKVDRTTQEIAAGQQKSQEQAAELQATTEKIAASVEAIASGFATLSQQGGIIADPERPDQFYHNARAYEQSGDMLNARRSYLAFAGFDVDAVDPYTRFATLLRVQDGRAGAREVFGTLAGKGKALSIQLVHALQFDDAQRISRLNDFIAANPDYAPAYYLRSLEFSEDRLGTQSLADKRAEAEALEKFLSYESDGGLLPFFIDQTQLAEWLDSSRRRLAALGNVLDPALFAPKLVPQRSNQGWMVTITLPESASSISWRLGNEGPFTETGFLAYNDQTTGKPMPNPSFVVPNDTPAGTVSLKYTDVRGQENGPFDIRFDPDAALAEGNKQVLDQFWTSWIAFDASGNTGLVYFTQMVSYRCGIKEVRYSLNGDALDKALDLPPCDAEEPYAIPNDYMPYFKVVKDVISMSVQVTYSDGTQSPVRHFKR